MLGDQSPDIRSHFSLSPSLNRRALPAATSCQIIRPQPARNERLSVDRHPAESIIGADQPVRTGLQINADHDRKGNAMTCHLARLTVSVVALGLLPAAAGCTDWSDRTQWPREREFEGRIVRMHREYLTGDYSTDEAAEGRTPAEYCNYYAYIENGQPVRHGRAAWWFPNGKVKAECIYVHGKKKNRSIYFASGVLAERVKVTADGERAEFFHKSGELFGTQQYDKLTGKRTCILRGRPVTMNDFMFEYARVVLGVKRVTP